MDQLLPDPRSPRSRRRRLPGVLITVLALASAALLEQPAQAGSTMGSIVRAFCLSAFENEMSQAEIGRAHV